MTSLHTLLESIEARVNQVGTDEFSQVLEVLRLMQALKKAIEQRDLYIDLIGKYEDETTAGFIERRNAELAAILSGETALQKLRDEFLNSTATKIDKCPECGFHSIAKLEDACLSALQAKAVEFDERSMIETATDMAQEFMDGLDGPCLGDYKAFALECYRRQFEQTKAQVAALKHATKVAQDKVFEERKIRAQQFDIIVQAKVAEIERLKAEHIEMMDRLKEDDRKVVDELKAEIRQLSAKLEATEKRQDLINGDVVHECDLKLIDMQMKLIDMQMKLDDALKEIERLNRALSDQIKENNQVKEVGNKK